jgi:CHAD domain-containing protein
MRCRATSSLMPLPPEMSVKRISRKIVEALPSNEKKDLATNPVSADVAAFALTQLAELSQPLRLAKTNLHPYRLKVKELRNLLQMAEESDQQEFVRTLGEVKDAIGEWHDWQELVMIAVKVLDHGSRCQLLRELRKIGDTKYRRALTLTETMRKQFLRMPDRRTKRASRHPIVRPAEPVWSATAALVA